MNVLFVLYGGVDTNSAVPLAIHARELAKRGHDCVVALPQVGPEGPGPGPLHVAKYGEALADPAALFANGHPPDVLHAWTPRELVRRFVTEYLSKRPAPWIAYLEDNEDWIARAALRMVGLSEDILLQHTEEVIATWTPEGIANVLHYRDFISLADGAAVLQGKLAAHVAPWVPCATVMPGVDLERFAPAPPRHDLLRRYGVRDGERVIVYPGGLNDFTRPGIESLCRAVGAINRRGVPCRLLRSGPAALDFLDALGDEAARITDLGSLPREELPDLLRLADVFVQPGEPSAFEDLRLPGKIPELFATGRPVVLPDTNIAPLLSDGVDAVILRSGAPEEIAEKCLALFADPGRARSIGEAGRRFAEAHFDPAVQAAKLEDVYERARASFDGGRAKAIWNAEAPATPVGALAARKLRLLASAGGVEGTASAAMLEAHARRIEFALERFRSLETGMAMRDREIAALKETLAIETGKRDRHIAALEGSLSWRITAPLRRLAAIVSRRKPTGRS